MKESSASSPTASSWAVVATRLKSPARRSTNAAPVAGTVETASGSVARQFGTENARCSQSSAETVAASLATTDGRHSVAQAGSCRCRGRLLSCLPKGATQDRQSGARCCLHGDGVDCSWPGQDEPRPCCLLPSTKVTHNKSFSHDPHAVCQRNSCVAYVPCAGTGRGVLCSSLDKLVCCLRESSPSAHDPCQLSDADCTARYSPCRVTDQQGIDCASHSGKSICCLSEGKEAGSCRRSESECAAYYWQQTRMVVMAVASSVAAIVLLLALCWRCYKHLRFCYRSLMGNLGNLVSPLLLPSGDIASASPLIDHPRRVLVAISCEAYSDTPFYPRLTTPHADAEVLAQQCQSMGYDEVLPVPGSTGADIDAGLRTAVQKVAGTTKALLVISYSGHAVEVDGRMMWAPESANHDDMGTHFDASCLHSAVWRYPAG
ncbi:unnamed protein product [Symbiodinium sp. CCMP2592]|nr:unnamed protein product [Symbiodinium sp. CCMP2592]